MSDGADSQSFNKNYKILKETADWLNQQKEPDIDQLVPRVESAMQAYKVCKTRLDAVQTTLSQYFEADGEAAPEHGAPSFNGHGRPAGGFRTASPPPPEDGDDIPF